MATVIPTPLLSKFVEPLFGCDGSPEAVCTSVDDRSSRLVDSTVNVSVATR